VSEYPGLGNAAPARFQRHRTTDRLARACTATPAADLTLAIFDLDETLIDIDSDHAFGEFLVARGLVDATEHRARNDAFYADYKRGELDIDAYLRFSCEILTRYPMARLREIRAEFFANCIESHLLPLAVELIADHRRRGHEPIIITSTQSFVTRPIADAFGIDVLIAPEPEISGERYTGRISGTPSFGPGKVTRLREWLPGSGHDIAGAYFYSDSHNDLPLLRIVDNPRAVDPDPVLRVEAERLGWPVITLRH